MKDQPVTVLDFETSGLSPHYGDKAIETVAVLRENRIIPEKPGSLKRGNLSPF